MDFADDAKLLFRVAACGNADAPLPAELGGGDAKAAASIAKIVDAALQAHRGQPHEVPRRVLREAPRRGSTAVVPKDVPKTVVYPFGGGDLLSALVAFPDATEITTISLEQAGDPRRLRTLDAGAARGEPRRAARRDRRPDLGRLEHEREPVGAAAQRAARRRSRRSCSASSPAATSRSRCATSRSTTTGAIDYLEQAEIEALDAKSEASKAAQARLAVAELLRGVRATSRSSTGSPARPPCASTATSAGTSATTTSTKNPQLLRHLEKKGKVTMLTKGASYLLWRGDFSLIRNYMLDHLAWMLSDSTGIPPQLRASRPAWCRRPTARSTARSSRARATTRTTTAFIELWRKNPRKPLGFRFGYVDKDKQRPPRRDEAEAVGVAPRRRAGRRSEPADDDERATRDRDRDVAQSLAPRHVPEDRAGHQRSPRADPGDARILRCRVAASSHSTKSSRRMTSPAASWFWLERTRRPTPTPIETAPPITSAPPSRSAYHGRGRRDLGRGVGASASFRLSVGRGRRPVSLRSVRAPPCVLCAERDPVLRRGGLRLGGGGREVALVHGDRLGATVAEAQRLRPRVQHRGVRVDLVGGRELSDRGLVVARPVRGHARVDVRLCGGERLGRIVRTRLRFRHHQDRGDPAESCGS